MSTDGQTGILKQLIASVMQRPFTELMALVMTAAIIALSFYDLKIGRPQMIEQINEGHSKAHDRYDTNLERTIQAHEKEVDLLREIYLSRPRQDTQTNLGAKQ